MAPGSGCTQQWLLELLSYLNNKFLFCLGNGELLSVPDTGVTKGQC